MAGVKDVLDEFHGWLRRSHRLDLFLTTVDDHYLGYDHFSFIPDDAQLDIIPAPPNLLEKYKQYAGYLFDNQLTMVKTIERQIKDLVMESYDNI